jgi:hypothetical protein
MTFFRVAEQMQEPVRHVQVLRVPRPSPAHTPVTGLRAVAQVMPMPQATQRPFPVETERAAAASDQDFKRF